MKRRWCCGHCAFHEMLHFGGRGGLVHETLWR